MHFLLLKNVLNFLYYQKPPTVIVKSPEKSRTTCLAQVSHKIQQSFNFYENWHNKQFNDPFNDPNFNDAIWNFDFLSPAGLNLLPEIKSGLIFMKTETANN